MDATTSRDDDAGTGIITLGRVEEEAEESALAHSYARVEQQAGERGWIATGHTMRIIA